MDCCFLLCKLLVRIQHIACDIQLSFFTNFAGQPATRVSGSTSLVTTEPAAITALSPIVTSFKIIEFAPI